MNYNLAPQGRQKGFTVNGRIFWIPIFIYWLLYLSFSIRKESIENVNEVGLKF